MLLHCLLTHQDSKLTVQHFISHLSKWESLESGFKKMGLGTWHVLWHMTTPHCFKILWKEKNNTDFWLTSWWHLWPPMGYQEAALCHSPAPGPGTGRTRERSPALVKECEDPSEDTDTFINLSCVKFVFIMVEKMALICQQTLGNHVEFKYLRYWQQ